MTERTFTEMAPIIAELRQVEALLVQTCPPYSVRVANAISALTAAAERETKLREENERLTEVCNDSNAVCLCGCPNEAHENYGEDGEACEHDDHQCLRTSRVAASMLADARAEVERLKAERLPIGYRAALEAMKAERDNAESALAAERQKIRELVGTIIRAKTAASAMKNPQIQQGWVAAVDALAAKAEALDLTPDPPRAEP